MIIDVIDLNQKTINSTKPYKTELSEKGRLLYDNGMVEIGQVQKKLKEILLYVQMLETIGIHIE